MKAQERPLSQFTQTIAALQYLDLELSKVAEAASEAQQLGLENAQNIMQQQVENKDGRQTNTN